MTREIIFGVYDKFGEYGSYTGYFKHEEDAKKELKSQMGFLMQMNGFDGLELKNDRVVKIEDGVETIYLIIHPIVLR